MSKWRATHPASPARFLLHVIVLLSFFAAPMAGAATQHTFSFDTNDISPRPATVNLAGSFNGWSKVATKMTDDGSGVFKVTIPLDDGVHYYKFVLDGDKWVNDSKFSDKDFEIDDNYGGRNSAVMIGPDARKLPAPAPDKINADGILHRADSQEDANVATPDLLRLRIRTQAGDVQNAFVNIKDDSGTRTHALYPCGSSMGYDFYGTAVTTHGKEVAYWFTLVDGSAKTLVGPDGAREYYPGDSIDAPSMYKIEMKPKFQTPDWAKNAVWYQIFPERFRNGDPANDPGDKEYEHLVKWTADWWKAQPGEAPGDENFYKGQGNVWKRRYGGDIQGLIKELPYLKSLGITAIYLNPMFKAESMHKYDTADYRHIDDHFGFKGDIDEVRATETDDPATWKWTKTDKLFLEFVEKAHAMGFKVILDGVFNHVGREFWAFQDVLKNGKNSKYADWFDVRDWNQPIKYIAWDRGGEPSSDGHLPVFKKNPQTGLGPGPTAHIFAITRRWLAPDGDPSKGIDGWRLDVPGDIPHPFWIEWRKVVKGTKPDAYISGEIWDWAQPWLNNGDQFDAVMNYRFATAAQDFFVNRAKAITPTQLNARLNEMIYNYPLQVSLAQQNLFDSHDTDRLASMFMNPDVSYDASNRIQDNGPKYSAAKPGKIEREKQREAVALQMTFVGAPMIYYGDENGMWSPDDPSNRQPMVWKDLEPYDNPDVKFDDDLFAWNQRLIAIREKFPALRTGFFHAVKIDDARGVFAFARNLNDRTVYVVLNRSDQEHTVEIPVAGENGTKFIDWLSPAQASVLPAADGDPKARPTVLPVQNAPTLQADQGVLSVQLKPFGAAIISELMN